MDYRSVIIVGGGSGSRFGGSIPKQFRLLNGKPVLLHVLQAFSTLNEIILVLSPGHRDIWEETRKKFNIQIPHIVAEGGRERYHSVKNGLGSIRQHRGLVAVHDAARPLIKPGLIDKAFGLAAEYGAAVPVVPVNETVRELKPGSSRIIPREYLRLVQTPQVFRFDLLKKAYEQDYRDSFTDDAETVEKIGENVHYFPGDPGNIKITYPEDLQRAEAIMRFLPQWS